MVARSNEENVPVIETALNEVLTGYVIENANLKIAIKQLEIELDQAKKVIEGGA